MRHGLAGKSFGRNSGWRKATVRDIAKAVLLRQRICTTKPRAKEARKLVDHLITLGKKGELAHKRQAFALIGDHQMVSELFRRTAPRFKSRNGGYTRIIPLGLRRGDSAQMAYLELTEKDEAMLSKARSSATAKTKDLQGAHEKKAKKPAEGITDAQVVKDTTEKPKIVKPESKKDLKQEKGKPGKKIVGGIKKMFQRKTGAE